MKVAAWLRGKTLVSINAVNLHTAQTVLTVGKQTRHIRMSPSIHAMLTKPGYLCKQAPLTTRTGQQGDRLINH